MKAPTSSSSSSSSNGKPAEAPPNWDTISVHSNEYDDEY